MKELAKDSTPTIANDEVDLMRRVVVEHLDWLETPGRRQSLVVELLLQLVLLDLTVSESAGWRTYIALHTTLMSLAEGELRDQVQVALAQPERDRISKIATTWEQSAGLFGYRLRPELGTAFEAMATLLSATMRGLVLMALSTPDMATHRAEASPFGAAGKGEWSLAALGIASIATAFLEPDPAIEWNEERLDSVRQALSSWVPPNA